MSVRNRVARELEELSEGDLKQVEDYISFLRFRSRFQAAPALSDDQLASLYAEFAEEDRRLAEEGMADFVEGLAKEDR